MPLAACCTAPVPCTSEPALLLPIAHADADLWYGLPLGRWLRLLLLLLASSPEPPQHRPQQATGRLCSHMRDSPASAVSPWEPNRRRHRCFLEALGQRPCGRPGRTRPSRAAARVPVPPER